MALNLGTTPFNTGAPQNFSAVPSHLWPLSHHRGRNSLVPPQRRLLCPITFANPTRISPSFKFTRMFDFYPFLQSAGVSSVSNDAPLIWIFGSEVKPSEPVE